MTEFESLHLSINLPDDVYEGIFESRKFALLPIILNKLVRQEKGTVTAAFWRS